MIECEIKLKIDNANEIKGNLLALGFCETQILTETDTYFDTKNGDIRLNDKALRIRESINHTTGQKFCQINFKEKKLDNKSVSRPEYESNISDANAMKKILNLLGFYPVEPKVVKNRIVLNVPPISACIDSVEGLGDFLELEIIVTNEEEKEHGLLKIESILEKLGYSLSDTTRTSYLTALQSKKTP